MATKSKTTKKARGSKRKASDKATKIAAMNSESRASAKTVSNGTKPKVAKGKNADTKRVSAIDAAARVLEKSGRPMRSRDLINAMTEKGLWSSPAGKTPWATLYASMIREIATAGRASRFKKVDRGAFAFNC